MGMMLPRAPAERQAPLRCLVLANPARKGRGWGILPYQLSRTKRWTRLFGVFNHATNLFDGPTGIEKMHDGVAIRADRS